MSVDQLNVIVNRAKELVSRKCKNKLNLMNMNLIEEFIDLSKNKLGEITQ